MPNLQLLPGTLPTNCYPSDPQQLYNLMFSLGAAVLGDLDGVIISDSAPAAEDRDKAWIKTNASAPLWPPIFVFYNGMWVMPNPEPASGDTRRIWVGSLASLITYDGGDAGALSAAGGAMWEEDTDFRDRIPMGVGTTLAVAVSTNYGDADASITLSDANFKNHTHFVAAGTANGSATPLVSASTKVSYSGGGMGNENYNMLGVSGDANVGLSSTAGGATGNNDPFSILNPVRGIYVIKRSSRIYYRGA